MIYNSVLEGGPGGNKALYAQPVVALTLHVLSAASLLGASGGVVSATPADSVE